MADDDMQVVRHAATLRLQVEEKLRNAIAAGRFRPGERLVERDLCARLDVSRTSVREALRQLEAEGLIVAVPHRGPVVASITLEEARQIYAVRALLEGFAARGFVGHAAASNLARLAGAVDALEAAAAGGGLTQRLIHAKTEFYDALLDGCGNAVVRQILKGLHNRVTLLRSTSMSEPGRLPQSLCEIRTIFERIAARDAEGAEAACIAHVERAAEAALRVLAAQAAGDGQRGGNASGKERAV